MSVRALELMSEKGTIELNGVREKQEEISSNWEKAKEGDLPPYVAGAVNDAALYIKATAPETMGFSLKEIYNDFRQVHPKDPTLDDWEAYLENEIDNFYNALKWSAAITWVQGLRESDIRSSFFEGQLDWDYDTQDAEAARAAMVRWLTRRHHTDITMQDEAVQVLMEFVTNERNCQLNEIEVDAAPLVEAMPGPIYDFVKDLVVEQTFKGFQMEDFLLYTLADKFNAPVTRPDSDDESHGIDGYIGDVPISIKPKSYFQKNDLDANEDLRAMMEGEGAGEEVSPQGGFIVFEVIEDGEAVQYHMKNTLKEVLSEQERTEQSRQTITD